MSRVIDTAEGRLNLDDEEEEAMDHLTRFLEIVMIDWQLTANRTELAAAVHTSQGFVIQHMLHRVAPADWPSWYAERR